MSHGLDEYRDKSVNKFIDQYVDKNIHFNAYHAQLKSSTFTHGRSRILDNLDF